MDDEFLYCFNRLRFVKCFCLVFIHLTENRLENECILQRKVYQLDLCEFPFGIYGISCMILDQMLVLLIALEELKSPLFWVIRILGVWLVNQQTCFLILFWRLTCKKVIRNIILKNREPTGVGSIHINVRIYNFKRNYLILWYF